MLGSVLNAFQTTFKHLKRILYLKTAIVLLLKMQQFPGPQMKLTMRLSSYITSILSFQRLNSLSFLEGLGLERVFSYRLFWENVRLFRDQSRFQNHRQWMNEMIKP